MPTPAVTPDRVGACYLVDHGSGHRSLRLVVGRLERDTVEGRPVWLIAIVDLLGGEQWTRYDCEDDLRYLDMMSERGSNVERLA